MNLLAIDTATESCSAALWVDGRLYHREAKQPRLHAELILPFIDELLQEAQIGKNKIQGIVVGQGPGAFTGVRIGIAVAQALALALDIPVVSVSNLKTLAYVVSQSVNLKPSQTVLVATDARMNEVYWSRYSLNDGKITDIDTEYVSAAADVNLMDVDFYIGNGFGVYPELIQYAKSHPVPYETQMYSHAKDMLLMIKEQFAEKATTVTGLSPVYLREP